MNKKELLKLPCTAPEWMQKKAKDSTKTTFLLRRNFGPIATYEIYLTKELEEGDIKPEFIIFKGHHDWINYYPKDNRWAKAKFENATIPVEENGRTHYSTYYLEQYDVLTNLRKWQDKIGKKRRKEKVRKERERIKNIMSLVPELPEDFMNFVENNLMKNANYIVYNRKADTAHCTRCEENYTVQELEIVNNTKAEHMKEYQTCPKCGVWMKQISSGLSRNKKSFRRGVEIMQKHGSGVVIREFAACRGFENKRKTNTMHTTVRELHRYIGDKKGFRKYELEADEWKDRTNSNFILYSPRDGKYYNKSVTEVLEGTEIAYEGIAELIRELTDRVTYNNGMEYAVKRVIERPYLEQLIKAGLKELVKAELFGETPIVVVIKEKETKVTKMLGINREELRIIRETEKQEVTTEIIQMLKKTEKPANRELILEAYKARENGATAWQLEKLAKKNIGMIKALKYISEKEIGVNDFTDHLELMEKLGIPKKKNNLYPKDFKRFHQEEIEEDILRNDEKIAGTVRKDFEKTYRRWKKLIEKYKVTTEESGYRVVLPETPMDIKIEGRYLHHCVGGYVNRAAKGETFIFYVRQEEDVRLYTAEYRNGLLIQIRASCNDDPEKEARKLAKKFAKELAAAEKQEKKSKKKHTKQTAIAV